MKKVLYLLLAVMLILPMAVACGATPEGEPIAIANVQVLDYSLAYSEATDGAAPTIDETMITTIFSGEVTAYVAEGAPLTLKDVVEGYIHDNNVDAVTNEAGTMYTSLSGLTEGDGFFWNFTVNGTETSLSATINATDTIVIAYMK